MISAIPNSESQVSGIPNLDLRIPESFQKYGIPASIPCGCVCVRLHTTFLAIGMCVRVCGVVCVWVGVRGNIRHQTLTELKMNENLKGVSRSLKLS